MTANVDRAGESSTGSNRRLEREHNVLSLEVLAVVELHSLPEVEGVGRQVLAGLPRRCQLRLDGEVRLDHQQVVVYLLGDEGVRRAQRPRRVKRVVLRHQRHSERSAGLYLIGTGAAIAFVIAAACSAQCHEGERGHRDQQPACQAALSELYYPVRTKDRHCILQMRSGVVFALSRPGPPSPKAIAHRSHDVAYRIEDVWGKGALAKRVGEASTTCRFPGGPSIAAELAVLPRFGLQQTQGPTRTMPNLEACFRGVNLPILAMIRCKDGGFRRFRRILSSDGRGCSTQ